MVGPRQLVQQLFVDAELPYQLVGELLNSAWHRAKLRHRQPLHVAGAPRAERSAERTRAGGGAVQMLEHISEVEFVGVQLAYEPVHWLL